MNETSAHGSLSRLSEQQKFYFCQETSRARYPPFCRVVYLARFLFLFPVFLYTSFTFFASPTTLCMSSLRTSAVTLTTSSPTQQQAPTDGPSCTNNFAQPAPVSRWLPDTSSFILPSYRMLPPGTAIDIIVQNYCLVHKTYYAVSWCPCCPIHI